MEPVIQADKKDGHVTSKRDEIDQKDNKENGNL